MSMLLKMELKEFFFFRRGAAQLLPVETGEVGGHLCE